MNQRILSTISKSAFDHNINLINQTTHLPTALVLKSNAYGHGILEIAQLAEQNQNIVVLCTAGIAEGLLLRNNNITKDILVLAYYDAPIDQAIHHNLTLPFFDQTYLPELYMAAKTTKKPAHVHIKIDTGMQRLGILPQELPDLIKNFNHELIKITGIFTHLNDKDNPDTTYTINQLKAFKETIDYMHNNGFAHIKTHAISSGALDYYDIVPTSYTRYGLHAYGFSSSQTSQKRYKEKFKKLLEFKPSLSLITHIEHIKELSIGATVSYNRTFTTTKPTRIALLPIGYFDGLPRGLSNKGHVLIHNTPAPILGLIGMNLTIVNITNIPQAHEDDKVVLIGEQQAIHTDTIAQLTNTINYEVITNIPPHIKRYLIK
jgi:alanine racemase